MKRRQWNAHTNAMIVIKGLKGTPVAELCNEHQIRQSLYDQWRDQGLAQAAKAFDDPQRALSQISILGAKSENQASAIQ